MGYDPDVPLRTHQEEESFWRSPNLRWPRQHLRNGNDEEIKGKVPGDLALPDSKIPETCLGNVRAPQGLLEAHKAQVQGPKGRFKY